MRCFMNEDRKKQTSPGVHNYSLCSFMRAKGVDIHVYEIIRCTILQSVFQFSCADINGVEVRLSLIVLRFSKALGFIVLRVGLDGLA